MKDKAYLEFALKRYEEREKELRKLIERESNEYKRNALKSELKNVQNAKKLLTNLLQSLQSESSSCEGANGRNPEQGRVAKTTLQSAWQVLKVALLFPILGKVLPRDLSPLKPVLVEGVWDRVRSRLVPFEAGGDGPDKGFLEQPPRLFIKVLLRLPPFVCRWHTLRRVAPCPYNRSMFFQRELPAPSPKGQFPSLSCPEKVRKFSWESSL